jgi:hypothetical protein
VYFRERTKEWNIITDTLRWHRLFYSLETTEYRCHHITNNYQERTSAVAAIPYLEEHRHNTVQRRFIQLSLPFKCDSLLSGVEM